MAGRRRRSSRPLAACLDLARDGTRETNYGCNSDSIATMGGAIAGALGGASTVPQSWAETVATGSRLDVEAGGLAMAEVAAELYAADEAAFGRRRAAFGDLRSAPRNPGEVG